MICGLSADTANVRVSAGPAASGSALLSLRIKAAVRVGLWRGHAILRQLALDEPLVIVEMHGFAFLYRLKYLRVGAMSWQSRWLVLIAGSLSFEGDDGGFGVGFALSFGLFLFLLRVDEWLVLAVGGFEWRSI